MGESGCVDCNDLSSVPIVFVPLDEKYDSSVIDATESLLNILHTVPKLTLRVKDALRLWVACLFTIDMLFDPVSSESCM